MAATDRDVLLVLYRSTDGPNWENNTNWCTAADLDRWYGVGLNEEGRVVKLTLMANDLRGIFKAYNLQTDPPVLLRAMSMTFPITADRQ